ncbi:MAG TPA: heparinase II/III family protein [Chryseolinea sp.]
MKSSLSFVVLLAIATTVFAQERKLPETFTLPAHPRILLLNNEDSAIQAAVTSNPVWKKMHAAILRECDEMMGLPLLERIQTGRRLLSVSRECIRRVFYLSYAYRMTGEEKYFQHAEKEMLAVAAFTDWNPSHFLDVAEMTMGMAIGYDWLHDKLSEESKRIIREAILKKGLEPSFDDKYNGFLKATHNWNQVCNTGMTFGALAIMDEYPIESRQIIDRALKTISLPMEDYKPDGAYPEGFSYWGYGTSFNVMFLSAMEKSFSSDYGLSAMPGFLNTPVFRAHMIGTTGASFNWGDCSPGANLSPAMFWFAQKKNDPSLLWMEKNFLTKDDYSAFTNDRLLPAAIIWGKEISFEQITEPASRVYVGQGPSPVALMRTSWSNPNGIYLGFKAGSASVNHAHMDIGSFIMESDGIRWAADLGMQDYESLESKGIQLWGRTQESQRWSVLRLNNFVHNTLTVDDKLQVVSGYSKIDRYSDKEEFSFAVSDLSTIYAGQLANVIRGVAIVDQRYVVIDDELTTLDKPTKVRWTMLTSADVSIGKNNTALLTKDGKQLTLRVESPAKVSLKTWSTQPTTTYDAANPGTTIVGFEMELGANSKEIIVVKLIPPGAEKKAKQNVEALSSWR